MYISLLQMLDFTTDFPQQNAVLLWNHDISTTGLRIIMFPQRDKTPLWNLDVSTMGQLSRCGILMIHSTTGLLTHCGIQIFLRFKQ